MDVVAQFVQDHWSEVLFSILSLLVGAMFGRVLAWRRWSRRAFFERINVSLNFVEQGELKIRTLLERSNAEVFRNAEMVRRVMWAARRRDGQTLLDLPEDTYWYYLNAVLNVISERFAEGYVKREAGLGAEHTYLMFLTSEGGNEVRQRKVRAMLIREDLLLKTRSDDPPRFRNEFHGHRWASLRAVADEWVASDGQSKRIRTISICV